MGSVRLRDFRFQTTLEAVQLCSVSNFTHTDKPQFTLPTSIPGLAKELNLSVWFPKTQHQLVLVAAEHGCQLCRALLGRCVPDRRKARLHIASMNQINVRQLARYSTLPDVMLPTVRSGLVELKDRSKNMRPVLAWRPTGWSHVPQKRPGTSFAPVLSSSPHDAVRGVRLEHSNGHVFVYGMHRILSSLIATLLLSLSLSFARPIK